MERAVNKMFIRDVAIVVGFVVFVWVIMCFIMSSVIGAGGPSHIRTILVTAGVAVLLLATLSLSALIGHLRRKRDEIYTEEIMQARANAAGACLDTLAEEAEQVELSAGEPHKTSSSAFVKVFDIVFIMALCFATLLATMLLRGKTVNGADIYSVGTVSVLVTVVGVTSYFIYIVRNSNRELKAMICELYAEEEPTGDQLPATEGRR